MLENLFGKEFYHAYFHYIVGVGILALGIIVANIIVVLLRNLLVHEDATEEEKANVTRLVSKIHFPINLVFVALSICVVHKLGDFPKEFGPYLFHGLKIILDLSFFMTLYYFMGTLVLTRLFIGLGLSVSDTIKELLANAVKIIIAVLGVVTVLGNFNINIGPVLGGLTVLTSAVALAAKDSIQGFLGSLTVVLEGKFQEGDWIKMADLEGFVENIGIRTTSIRGLDSTLTVVPNDAFVASSITNLSRIRNWRVKEEFVLMHTSTQDQLEKIVSRYRDWLLTNPEIEADPNKALLVVRVSGLVEHGFSLLIIYYTKTNKWPEHVRVREECIFQLLKIVEEVGTSFAHPVHKMFLEGAISVDQISNGAAKTPAITKSVAAKKPSDEAKPTPKEKK
jgi:small-conductance mechanosensitive channel